MKKEDINWIAKTEYERNLIQGFTANRDPRIYRYIKQFTKSHTLPPQLHFNSITANTDHSKAELFSQYFFSVFTNSTSQELNPDEFSIPANSLDAVYLTESDVFNALVNLNPHKATGIDYIAPSVLKNCATSLCGTIVSSIYNQFEH